GIEHRTAVAPSGLWGFVDSGDPGLANSASPGLHSLAPSGHLNNQVIQLETLLQTLHTAEQSVRDAAGWR
ncbi:MAG TPA: hypothetical protein VF173_16895, partial [Thermoanaerobaculia bacterium]|nr:hypothetical protein [Thermoanaerobaculia bacterium]